MCAEKGDAMEMQGEEEGEKEEEEDDDRDHVQSCR